MIPKDKIAKDDFRWMKRALELAKRGIGKVEPNPAVGCVIVKNGKKLSDGYHKSFGGPHAEIEALKNLKNRGKSAKGATLYVTLEPCVHFGKTPPCAPEIIASGVTRAVIGVKDMNPEVNGKGIQMLKKAGIKTDIIGRPRICVKVAMSLDGKIATKKGESKWITSEEARNFAKKLRDGYGAILVGKNTVLKDNPQLSGRKKNPLRVILDSKLQTSPYAKVYRDENAAVVATDRAPSKKIIKFQNKGMEVKIFHEKIRLDPLLEWLFSEKFISGVLVEGGSEISGSFFDAGLVDDVYFFISPRIIGGRNAKPAVQGKGIERLRDAFPLKKAGIRKIGGDFLIFS